MPVLGDAPLRLPDGFLPVKISFREELISVAYNLFFQCLWQQVFMRQRKPLTDNLAKGKSGTGVALAHTRMTRHAFAAQHLRAYHSVTYVRLRAVALYSRSIGFHDTYVMQHGCLNNKITVEPKLRMHVGNMQCLLSH